MMRVSLFLKVLAVWLSLNGAASLFIPQVAAAGLAHTLNTFDLFAIHTIGVLLLTLALMNWVASDGTSSTLRGALWANLFLNGVLAFVDSMGLLQGTITGGWFGVALHGVMLIGVVYYLARWKPVAHVQPHV